MRLICKQLCCGRSVKFFCLLLVASFLFSAFSGSTKPDKFNLSGEEYVWLEKFFRKFMLYENGIYTLVGSKPLMSMHLIYYDTPEEQLREEEREEYSCFLLNRDSENDMKFYSKLSRKEQTEKVCLVRGKDYIYDFENLWEKWEKIQHRFPLKKRYLLVKRQRDLSSWKKIDPKCTGIYDIYFVDVLKTALIIQEHYELFKQVVGCDFDPLRVVFEIENEKSNFWDKLFGEEASKHAYLWGILYGFGKENSFYYYWKSRHLVGFNFSEKEKLLTASMKQLSSCRSHRPSFKDKDAYSLSNFSIPPFASFSENDPIVAKYEAEKEKIQQLYKKKNFVTYTLELLTQDTGS